MMHRVVVRTLLALAGICAIAWAVGAITVFRANAGITDTAQRILSGDRFNSAQLGAMRRDLAALPQKALLASAERSAVTIRLRLLEDQLKQEQPKTGTPGPVLSDIDELRSDVGTALALTPTDSFMWLAAFWLNRQRNQVAGNDVNLLRMSYSTGPYEGWIAVRRSALALSMLGRLPDELASQALGEFVQLLRSGLYADAANILAGPAWPVRDQLLEQLDQVDESDRQAFAKAVDAKDLTGVEIPLLEKRPDRPF
jgi:hypothetical protein